LSGRRDILVVASVSCIYGAGNPNDYENSIIRVSKGQIIARNAFLHELVNSLYSRTTDEFKRGNFRVKGDVVDVYLAYNDFAYRISFFGNEIEEIQSFDPANGQILDTFSDVAIYPANIYVSPKERLNQAIYEIQDDLVLQMEYFKSQGKNLEARKEIQK
jgi:excinuclease ABC subunit B